MFVNIIQLKNNLTSIYINDPLFIKVRKIYPGTWNDILEENSTEHVIGNIKLANSVISGRTYLFPIIRDSDKIICLEDNMYIAIDLGEDLSDRAEIILETSNPTEVWEKVIKPELEYYSL